MSVHLTDLVWRRSCHKGSELLVLLSIADNADSGTGQAYPSIEHIAGKTRLSKGGVHAILKKLLAGDELSIVKKGARGRATVYRIEVAAFRPKIERNGLELGECVHFGPEISSLASAPQPSVEPSESLFSSETSSPQRDDVETVYDDWRTERGRFNKRWVNSRYDKISQARRGKIKTRLEEFSVEELRQAIRGVANDPWDGRAQNDDLTIIFRSHEQVDKFLALSEGGEDAETSYRRFAPGEQA